MNREYFSHAVAALSIVIGAVVSWYFYDLSVQRKIPELIQSAETTPIFLAQSERPIPLLVRKIDGTKLDQSVYVTTNILWNRGNAPIIRSDVLSPVTIKILNPDVEILSVDTTRQSRKMVNCKVTPDGKTSFVVTFDVLEFQDGCELTIFYSGSRALILASDHAIVGARNLEIRYDKHPSRTFPNFAQLAFLFSAFLIFLAFAAYEVYKSRLRIRLKNEHPELRKRPLDWPAVAATILGLFSVVINARDAFFQLPIPDTRTWRSIAPSIVPSMQNESSR